MTFKIIVAIHFEAFKLWTKGIKFIQKKLKIRKSKYFLIPRRLVRSLGAPRPFKTYKKTILGG